MSRRSLSLLAALSLLIVLALSWWLLLRWRGRATGQLVLTPASFSDLPGWDEDAVAQALPALLRSCRRLAGLPDDAPLGGDGFAGTAGSWRPACMAAASLP